MHDISRFSLLNVANVVLVAMIVLLLGGCVSTPPRRLHGDFIMNIGSAAPVPAVPEATMKFATASQSGLV